MRIYCFLFILFYFFSSLFFVLPSVLCHSAYRALVISETLTLSCNNRFQDNLSFGFFSHFASVYFVSCFFFLFLFLDLLFDFPEASSRLLYLLCKQSHTYGRVQCAPLNRINCFTIRMYLSALTPGPQCMVTYYRFAS